MSTLKLVNQLKSNKNIDLHSQENHMISVNYRDGASWVLLKPSMETLTIHAALTDNKHLRKGYATQLHKLIIHAAKKAKYQKIVAISVRETNKNTGNVPMSAYLLNKLGFNQGNIAYNSKGKIKTIDYELNLS